MKTILRSTLAVALLASSPLALAGEDPPDVGTTGLSSPPARQERAPAQIAEAIAKDAPLEGAAMAAAHDEEPDRRSGADPLDRSMDAGG
jgi:hypothetical protein